MDLFKKKSKEALAELKLWRNDEFRGRQKQLKQLKEKLITTTMRMERKLEVQKDR